MLEWARQLVHRLLQDDSTSLESGKEPGGRTLGGRGTTRGFDRFLQEFQAHNEENFHEGSGGKRAA